VLAAWVRLLLGRGQDWGLPNTPLGPMLEALGSRTLVGALELGGYLELAALGLQPLDP
jgi:hypothetical protein